MTKHTPGPWHYQPELNLVSGDDWTVCYIPTVERRDYRRGEEEANARLIAAAPEIAAERDRLHQVNADLVEALKLAIDDLYHLTGRMEDAGSYDHTINQGNVAIAKATADDA
jgi:hypothetical protein